MWQIIWAFISVAALPTAKKILVGLGIGFVTYQGLSVVTSLLLDYIFSEFQGLPGNVVAIIGILRIDEAINILFSAIAFRAVISGWNSGAKTQQVWKKPGAPFEA